MKNRKLLVPLMALAGGALALAGCSSQAGDVPSTDSDASTNLEDIEVVEAPEEDEEPGLGDTELNADVRDMTVLVVGDSMAHAMGVGMSDAVEKAAADGGEARNVTIVNAAMGGCGLARCSRLSKNATLGPNAGKRSSKSTILISLI